LSYILWRCRKGNIANKNLHTLSLSGEGVRTYQLAGATRRRWQEIAWEHHGACRHHQGVRREARSQRMATQARFSSLV
jgi:hypothetical protein